MKTFTPVPKQYYFLILIIIADFMHFTICVNMWTSLEQKQANNKTPAKRCVSPCRIFHTWCKNDGKCREKGPDCTWYCECPSNCEGFFCEKIVEKGITDGEQKVEVKVTYEKDKTKNVSAFDQSKLAQALAGIFMKETKTEEEKETVVPDTDESVGKTIDTKENLTTNIIINCPPGALPPDSPISQTFEITNETKTNDSMTQESSGQELQSVLEPKVNVSGQIQNRSTGVTKPISSITSGNTQSVNTHSSVTPIVKSSFSVTYSTATTTTTKQVAEENVSKISDVLQDTENTTTVTTPALLESNTSHSTVPDEKATISTSITPSSEPKIESTMLPSKFTPSSQRQDSTTKVPYITSTKSQTTETTAADKTINNFTTNEKSNKHLSPAQENSLYIKNENVIETTNKPDLLKIIEKAIEIEFITTVHQQSSTSKIPTTTESVLVHRNPGPSSEKTDAKAKLLISEEKTLSTSTEVNLLRKNETLTKASTVISSVVEKGKTQNSTKYNKLNNDSSTTVKPSTESKHIKVTSLSSQKVSKSRANTTSTLPTAGTTSVPTTQISADNKTENLNFSFASNGTQGKHNTSNEMNLTIIAVKTSQTTEAPDTSKNQRAPLHQRTFSTTRASLEQHNNVKKLGSVITTESTVTPFNTKSSSTTSTKTGTESSGTIKQNLATDVTKNNTNLSKGTSSEYSGINKSQSENSATGDINNMSAVNGQLLSMTGAIIASHDMPKQTEQNMSTLQTDMSSLSTKSQYISRNVTESVKVASPSLSSENNESSHLQKLSKNNTLNVEKLKITGQSKNAAQEVAIESTSAPTELHPQKTAKHVTRSIQVISETAKNLQQLDQSKNDTESVTVASASSPPETNERLKTTDHQRKVAQNNEENSANPSSQKTKRLLSNSMSTSAKVSTEPPETSTGTKEGPTTTASATGHAKEGTTVNISATGPTSTKPGTSLKPQVTGPAGTKQGTTSETPTTGPTGTEQGKTTQDIKNIEQKTQLENSPRKNTFSNEIKLPGVKSTSQTYETSTKQMLTSSTISLTSTKEGITNSSPASTTHERTSITSVFSDTEKLNQRTSVEPKTTQSTNSTSSSSTPQTPAAPNLTPSAVTNTENYTEQNASELAETTGATNTSPKANEFVSTTESNTKTDDTTKSQLEKNVLKTRSDLNSADLPVAENAKMSLAKAFLENQSDLFKQSKVKNEILTNKLSESVKDLNFDLLETKLQDKGLPSDIDNIL